MGSSQLVGVVTTTTGGVLKWLTSADSADAEAVVTGQNEAQQHRAKCEAHLGCTPKSLILYDVFEVESASIDTAHDERRPGGWWPFREDLYRGPGWCHGRAGG